MTSLSDYSQEIRPLLNLILVTTPLGSVLIPFLLILFFFSTPQSRRHPIFICNVLSCGCGICQAIMTVTMTAKAILYPLHPTSRSLFTTASIFYLILSLFIDSIIIFRILAFYPLSATPSRKLLMIFALPILVKCGRLITAVMYIHQLTHVNFADILVAVELIGPKNPYILAAVALKMIDNGYASGILLFKIHQFKRDRDEIIVIRSKNLVSCLRSLFIIALGNFIFPVIINVASIILLATNLAFSDTIYVMIFNDYISIMGVVFATIWTRRRYWNRNDHDVLSGSNEFQLEPSRHANRPTLVHTRTVLSRHYFEGENEEGVVDVAEPFEVQKSPTGEKQGNIDNSSHLPSTKAQLIQ